MSVREYSAKIEYAYHELMQGMTEGRSALTSKQISEVIKVQAFSVFISGIITPIKNILKGRNIKSLEEAIAVAIEEEACYENEQ